MRVFLVGVAATVLGALADAAAGGWAAVGVTAAASVLTALVARGMLPAKPARPEPRTEDPPAPSFPAYRWISGMVSSAGSSEHYYDVVARPYLASMVAALLADRRRLELRDAAAAAAIGPAWRLIDPDVRRDGAGPVDLAALAALVERLEAL